MDRIPYPPFLSVVSLNQPFPSWLCPVQVNDGLPQGSRSVPPFFSLMLHIARNHYLLEILQISTSFTNLIYVFLVSYPAFGL